VRVRVGCHLQALCTSRSQNLDDVVDMRGGNPAPRAPVSCADSTIRSPTGKPVNAGGAGTGRGGRCWSLAATKLSSGSWH
jgi:hypothetical protein